MVPLQGAAFSWWATEGSQRAQQAVPGSYVVPETLGSSAPNLGPQAFIVFVWFPVIHILKHKGFGMELTKMHLEIPTHLPVIHESYGTPIFLTLPWNPQSQP